MLKEQTTEQHVKNVYFVNFTGGTTNVTVDGVKKTYGSVSGHLEQIQLTEREFKGVKQKYWYAQLRDGEDLYKIGFYYNNSAFKSLILNLYGNDVKETDTIEITPYNKGEFTNVNVKKNGNSLKWADGVQLPPVEKITVNGQEQSDSTKRMLFIEELATKINTVLKSN